MGERRSGGESGQRERCEAEGDDPGGLATSGHGGFSFGAAQRWDAGTESVPAISKLAARKDENACWDAGEGILMVALRCG
ncbi:hypothetical protein Smic_13960 [Streptomyces microflavus]|uniref:Uncharacterized protein n=1 Tax=Streptomyces microflavus TaxID=1919 RepID=A0A7J0CK31_STRMI|nr:hypothetical protein Smic_13960 [Streptomyces microflavus]